MRATTGAALALAGLIVAGCADSVDDEVELEVQGDRPAAESAIAGADAARAGDERAGGAPLAVDSIAGGRAYLTDPSGRALYLLEDEPEGRGTCTDACAEAWPPYTVSGTPDVDAVRGGELRADMIGTYEREDGTLQLTYRGHALYYYHDDQGPGQTLGQDVTDRWGEWYLVTPGGDALEPEEEGGEGAS